MAMTPDARGLEFLASAMPMATRVGRPARSGAGAAGVPVRLRRADGAGDGAARGDERRAGARAWSRALAEELAAAPRLDRERFRAVANRVKARTGQKGKALFHPIRVALTGRAEGPELDLAVPAIDRGAELPGRRASRRSSAAASARRPSRAALRAQSSAA